MPDGPVEPGGRVPELLTEYDNIYGDLSGQSGWNTVTRDPDFGQAILEAHAGQLVFGTDYFYRGQDVSQFDLWDRFDLDLDSWADIRYRNLVGIIQ